MSLGAGELPNLPLEDALKLVLPYAEARVLALPARFNRAFRSHSRVARRILGAGDRVHTSSPGDGA